MLAYDKAKMLHHLELLVNNEQLVVHTPALETSTTKACDNNNVQEMAASENTIHKTDQIKTCNDFTEVFLDQLINMADNTMK